MMSKKIDKCIDVILYYVVTLIISILFKKLGWLEGNAFTYAFGITTGWMIVDVISYLHKKRKQK